MNGNWNKLHTTQKKMWHTHMHIEQRRKKQTRKKYMTFTLISSCSRCEFCENCKTNAETGIFRRIYDTHKKTPSDCSVSNGYFIKKRQRRRQRRRWRKIPWTVSNECNLSSVYDSIWMFFLWKKTLFSTTFSLGRDFYRKNQSRKQTASGGSREKLYTYDLVILFLSTIVL